MSSKQICPVCHGAGEAWHSDYDTHAQKLMACESCLGTGRERTPAVQVSEAKARLALEKAIAAAARFGLAKAKSSIRVCPLDEDTEQAMRAIDDLLVSNDSEWDELHSQWAKGEVGADAYLATRAQIIERKIVEIRQRGIDVRDLDKALPTQHWLPKRKA